MVIAFCSAGLFAACASGNTEQGLGAGGFGGGSLTGPTTTTTSPTTGPTVTSTSTSGGMGGGMSAGPGSSTSTSGGAGCAPKCNIDADCQNTCQSPPSGVYCCDTMNGMCYHSAKATCMATSGAGPGSSTSSSGY